VREGLGARARDVFDPRGGADGGDRVTSLCVARVGCRPERFGIRNVHTSLTLPFT